MKNRMSALGLGVVLCAMLGVCPADKTPTQTTAPPAAPAPAVNLSGTAMEPGGSGRQAGDR